jgi:N-acetylmuramoyl-L-alanine amidase
MICGCLFIRNLFKGNIEVASMLGLTDRGEDGQIDDLASGLRIVIDAGHGGTDSG